jgi:hypothetical protein
MGRRENLIGFGFFLFMITGSGFMVVLQNCPIGFIVKLVFVLLKGVAAEVFGFGEILKGQVTEGSFGFVEKGHWSLGKKEWKYGSEDE